MMSLGNCMGIELDPQGLGKPLFQAKSNKIIFTLENGL